MWYGDEGEGGGAPGLREVCETIAAWLKTVPTTFVSIEKFRGRYNRYPPRGRRHYDYQYAPTNNSNPVQDTPPTRNIPNNDELNFPSQYSRAKKPYKSRNYDSNPTQNTRNPETEQYNGVAARRGSSSNDDTAEGSTNTEPVADHTTPVDSISSELHSDESDSPNDSNDSPNDSSNDSPNRSNVDSASPNDSSNDDSANESTNNNSADSNGDEVSPRGESSTSTIQTNFGNFSPYFGAIRRATSIPPSTPSDSTQETVQDCSATSSQVSL